MLTVSGPAVIIQTSLTTSSVSFSWETLMAGHCKHCRTDRILREAPYQVSISKTLSLAAVKVLHKYSLRPRPDLVLVPGHCAVTLKGMLFRHRGALSFVSICCGVLFTLLCSFIICCSCSCSSLLEAIPSIVSCTIFCIYRSNRFVDRPFRARHLVTATTAGKHG